MSQDRQTGEEHGVKSGKRWSSGREPGNTKGGRNRAGSDLESLDSTLALGMCLLSDAGTQCPYP